jgi:hypothetical protein
MSDIKLTTYKQKDLNILDFLTYLGQGEEIFNFYDDQKSYQLIDGDFYLFIGGTNAYKYNAKEFLDLLNSIKVNEKLFYIKEKVEEQKQLTFVDLKKANCVRIYHDEEGEPYEYGKTSKRWPAQTELVLKYALENEYKIEIVE